MILKTYARVFTPNLETSLSLFQQLIGREPDIRFTYGNWEIAAIGDFLLVAGDEESLAPIRNSHGPVIVDSLAHTQQLLEKAGAVITQPATAVPTGTMLYAQHPDGTNMEYVEWTQEVVKQIIG
jgi:hypothetical protein